MAWSLESACHLRLCAIVVVPVEEEAIAPPNTFHHMLMQPTHSTTLNYWS